ncbi:MAG: cytochrome C oxidase subunit IV family protein [Planctomycetota bacterium]|nr:cytochrome C oxidase subunit IV family protein [Planctomycetota bacterium]MEC8559477.1 cytochrome C oxidase subunit IV family protein [Planctomycetota bacterium]MEC8817911.1 cytochrome C oxidase subunit IV family protein [Planctomycetota bacterium]MEC9156749.1 cytochrome C oxidase subunit IV family protein [Planctomycetota bacterium]MEC9232935.1 cytochrome C oxidase subunit IV family protein [Planctomycetota bacterium]
MASRAHAQHRTDDTHPIVGHLVPMSTLVWTTLALLVLTILTVAVRYIDVGEFNIVIAIGIAVLKATLVALFFMHLWWDRPFNQIVFVACISFVVLLIALTVIDTKQNAPTLYTGNPARVQEVLDAKAPEAPITKQTGLSSPG